jgi:raffinose/stachyose/melibiose transport system permease protein
MNSNASKVNENIQRWLMRLILLLCAALIIFPLIFVFLTSLKSSADFYTNIWGLPKQIAWKNYEYAWNVAEIGRHFFTSLQVVSITVLVTLFIASIAGYALAKLKIPFANEILISMFLLSMLPSEAIIMPMYLMISKLGFGGTYASLILPYIGWGLPITIYIYKNFFSTLPTSIIEAARIEGCTEGRTYFSIVMPIMLPATATNAIFLFLGWWGEMLWAAVELSTASIKTLPLGLTAFIQSAGTAWGPLSAASCIVLIPAVIVFLFFQRFFISGITGGASKG